MSNSNSNHRLEALAVVFSRALCAVKNIAAVAKSRPLVLAAIVFAFSAVAVASIFTPASGIVRAPVFARASFAEPTDIKFKIKSLQGQEVLSVNNAQQTVVQEIVIAPGGHTGWHSHPGPVVVLIKAGQMSFYDGDDPTCTGRTYSAGEAFIDSGQGHVHIARNEGSENLEVWATYFDVPPGASPRIDAPNPGNCGF